MEEMASAQFLNLFEMGEKMGVEHCSQEGLAIDNRTGCDFSFFKE